ncbi:MAG: signal transduction histidine kinase, partial [Myxococcota bacterium]
MRARSFWAGWGGGIITVFTGVLMAALLVGWVLLWVNRPGGANIPLLTIGCVAFTLGIAVMVTLHNRLTAHWRLRQAEALFLTGVSHSLRTPIGAIRAAAQLLEGRDIPPDRYDRLVTAIIQETRRLALRVDNVLETGRLEVERAAFGGEAVDVGAVVQATADDLAPVIDNREGKLSVSVSGHAPVLADPRALRLMLDNVVDNALNYAIDHPEIHIDMECQ